jgi:hypothetical protein
MNWEAIGAVGEIVGAVAVVITLAYLAIQVRQNNRMMQRQAHLDRVRHIADPLIESPRRLVEVLGKISAKDGSREPVTLAFMDAFDLQYDEAIPFLRYLHRLWLGYEADFLFTGRSDHLDKVIPAMLTFPNCELFWQYEKEWLFSPEFVAYVDGLADAKQVAQRAKESISESRLPSS